MNKEKQEMNVRNNIVLLTFVFTNFASRDHAVVMKLEDEPERGFLTPVYHCLDGRWRSMGCRWRFS